MRFISYFWIYQWEDQQSNNWRIGRRSSKGNGDMYGCVSGGKSNGKEIEYRIFLCVSHSWVRKKKIGVCLVMKIFEVAKKRGEGIVCACS